MTDSAAVETAADFAHVARSSDIVRYAQVWEDSDVLRAGLAVTPDDDVLSIGSAGCNVLALLLDEPRGITAIDLNPAQSALIDLKVAGIRTLRYNEFACLIGARDGDDRLALYQRARGTLSAKSKRYWDQRPADLAQGVMHIGRLERYLQGFQREHVARLIPGAAVAHLLSLDDRDAQRALFARHFDTPSFRASFSEYFSRDALARDGRDRTQFTYVGSADVTELLWSRFRDACTLIPARGNFYLEYILTGTYRDLELSPSYLRRGNFERLRALVDRVEIITGDLADHLDEVEAGRYSKVNLSDLFEYLSDTQTDGIFQKLAAKLRPAGRMCLWNLFIPRSPSASQRGQLRSHPELATSLWQRDRAFFYRQFHVEEKLE
ncbi:DUF3419 family protein [Longispora urticae]